MAYELLKADVINMGLSSRYEVALYLAALDIPLKPYTISLIERLYNEGIIAV